MQSALKKLVLKMKSSKVQRASVSGSAPWLHSRHTDRDEVYSSPIPSANWALLRLQALPIVCNSKNVQISFRPLLCIVA